MSIPESPDTPKDSLPVAGTTRRDFLCQLSVVTAGTCAAAALPACSLFQDQELYVGELADLQRQHVLEPDFNGNRIHLRPDLLTAQPIALSLICSHKQCTVAWQPEAQRFECPCHKGQYDAQGQVLAGKPKAPLRQFRVEIRNGTQIWVLNESPVS